MSLPIRIVNRHGSPMCQRRRRFRDGIVPKSVSLSDFTAYWRFNSADLGVAQSVIADDYTANTNYLYYDNAFSDPGVGGSDGIPGNSGEYVTLGIGYVNTFDGGYESPNLAIYSWNVTSNPGASGVELLSAGSSWSFCFWYRDEQPISALSAINEWVAYVDIAHQSEYVGAGNGFSRNSSIRLSGRKANVTFTRSDFDSQGSESDSDMLVGWNTVASASGGHPTYDNYPEQSDSNGYDWNLFVYGFEAETQRLFMSFNNSPKVYSPVLGENLAFKRFLCYPGTHNGDSADSDGDHNDYIGWSEYTGSEVQGGGEVLNISLDAMGVIPRVLTQREIAYLWAEGAGVEL